MATASAEAGRGQACWNVFPAEWVERLRSKYSQPLVALELLESPEGFEDVLGVISGNDILQTALLRGRLQALRNQLAVKRKIVQSQVNAGFKKPRLPVHQSDSSRAQETFAVAANALVPFTRKRGKSGLGRSLLAVEDDPDILESRERERWVEVLSTYIIDAQLPVVALIEGSEDRRQAWRRVFGARRAKTLRNRARSFKHYRMWLETVRGLAWPSRVSDVTDFLEERSKCGFSVPGELLAALSVLESVGRVHMRDRFSSDETVKAVAQSITEELQGRAAPRRPAKLYTMAMLIALEIHVLDEDASLFSRIIAWVISLQHWTAMRADDVQWLDPGRMTLTDSGLSGVLRRTKTTGPGRRAREVPVYVGREVSLSGNDWLQVGFALFKMPEVYWERMYFLPFPSADWTGGVKKHLSPEMLNVCIKRVLAELSVPQRGEHAWVKSSMSLLPQELLPYWSGHSARHWLPSWAATLGVSKPDRVFLGRWQAGAHESNEYIVTSREVVHRVQMQVVEGAAVGHSGIDERPLLNELQEFANTRGVSFARGAARHRVWRTNDSGHRALLLGFPLDYEHITEGLDVEAALEVTVEDEDGLDPDVSCFPYWVSISRRSQFRRLHAKDKCGIMPWSVFRAEGFRSVDSANADAWCKTCWKKVSCEEASASQEVSSSGSSSSTELEEPEQASQEE
ncbi:unnamed protein product [Symbiodinium sp. CCMP2592]|nr:unnamed protein product [Symbiodinium sp. CCMP2592]